MGKYQYISILQKNNYISQSAMYPLQWVLNQE